MIKEPDWSKKDLSYGEVLGPAMAVRNHEEAEKYFDNLIKYMMRFYPKDEKTGKKVSIDEHIRIQKSNLGYYAGYYDDATAARVAKYFGAVHPIFGTARITPKQAFEAGKKAGEKFRSTGKSGIKKVNQSKGFPRQPRHAVILED